MKRLFAAASAMAIGAFFAINHFPATEASAATECHTDKAADELERAEAETLYNCIIDGLVKGWQKGGHPVALEYKNWAAASTYAAATGTHGNRLLYTYVNEIGKEDYLAFADEGVAMPVGTIIAKESFSIGKKGDKKGKPQPGPLFLMEKVAAGTFDETANWKYTLITPGGKAWLESGKTEAAKVQKFCHECHSGTSDFQDSLFYPAEEARVSAK